MGIDWEYYLDAEGEDLIDAYDDCIYEASRNFEENMSYEDKRRYEEFIHRSERGMDDYDPEFDDETDDEDYREDENMFKYEKDMFQTEFLKSLMKHEGIEDHYLARLGKKVREYLINEGYAVHSKGSKTKEPTDKGRSIGLSMKDGENRNGEKFTTMLFGKEAQELIASLIWDFVSEIDKENGGKLKRIRPKRPAEKVSGTFHNHEVTFNRCFANYRFDDEEVKRLLNGEVIPIHYIDRNYHKGEGVGRLQFTEWKGRKLCQFRLSSFPDFRYDYMCVDL